MRQNNEMDWSRPLAGGGSSPIVYDIKKGDNAFLTTDTPEFEQLVKMTRTWYENGYWSKSILSNKTEEVEAFKNGQSVGALQNVFGGTGLFQYSVEKNLPWDIE